MVGETGFDANIHVGMHAMRLDACCTMLTCVISGVVLSSGAPLSCSLLFWYALFHLKLTKRTNLT